MRSNGQAFKAGTQENLEVDRVESPAVASHPLRVPKPMAAGPTQRVGDNAFHLAG